MKVLILTSLLKLLCESVYIKIISTFFSSRGFLFEFDIIKYFVGWLLFFFGVIFLNLFKEKVSTMFLYVYYYVTLLPGIIIYQFMPQNFNVIGIQYVAFLLIGIMLKLLPIPIVKLKKFYFFNNKYEVPYIIVILLSFAFVIGIYGFPKISGISIDQVSSARNSMREQGLFGSLVIIFLGRCFLPILFMHALSLKHYFKASFIFALQAILFLISGFKTILFIPIVLFGIYVARKLHIKEILLVGLIVIIAGSYLMYLLTTNIYIPALFYNRVLFFPSLIKWAYFDFFSTNEFDYFAQTTIGRLLGISSEYGNIRYLIGETYFHSSDMWTNAGFVADAYANAGFIGVVLMIFILFVVLKFIDENISIKSNKLEKVMGYSLVLYFLALNDGSLISVLFSGGLLLNVLILSMIKYN